MLKFIVLYTCAILILFCEKVSEIRKRFHNVGKNINRYIERPRKRAVRDHHAEKIRLVIR